MFTANGGTAELYMACPNMDRDIGDMALLLVAVAAVWSMQLGASAQGRRSNWPGVDGRRSRRTEK